MGATLPATPDQRRGIVGRSLTRALVALVIAVVAVAIGAGVWIRSQLRASLAQLDGTRAVPGLTAAVLVDRDELGVPTLRAANRLDAARALGFVHAQDRYFQMDLLRRSAAGELAELFGRSALPLDRRMRPHRFRAVATRVSEVAVPDERELLAAYTEGVNAGLSALGSAPFEYLLLRTKPVPWRPEDSILVVLAMFAQLQDVSGRRESSIGLMRDLLPRQLVDFLVPPGTEWDAPLLGGPLPGPPIPGPDVFDLRAAAWSAPPASRLGALEPETWLESTGSNNWAVAANHAQTGRALVANDMHLGLSIPNTWYRATIAWTSDGEQQWMSGVSLPGTPVITVGSNRHVAWAFTNSHGDWSDLVVLEPAPGDTSRYLTPEGPRAYEHHLERIAVKEGQPDETIEVLWTVWGPVIDRDHLGRPRALRWTAHDPEAINSALQRLERAKTLAEALDLAQRAGIPTQNFVCADADGHIGWTLAGRIPRRVGFDGQVPTSWANGSRRWDGWLRPEEYPKIIDPPSGRLWTANARVLDRPMLDRIGDGGYANGSRARQIRDALLRLDRATARDMLQIQLDDRALFLARWRDVLLAALTEQAMAGHSRRREVKQYVENWGGRAAIDSVGYRAVERFRYFLERQVFGALTARCLHADPKFDFFYASRQSDGPLWAMVKERPAHLLSPTFKNWDEQILAAADAMLDSLGADISKRNWGERNRVHIQHPFSRAMPSLARFLDMPSEPLPGDAHMPRVQTPDHGASERLVVSPGREEEGFFHMPGGQSGHPLSPFYRAGHEAWAHGDPTPFLPGPSKHHLTLLASPGT